MKNFIGNFAVAIDLLHRNIFQHTLPHLQLRPSY